MIAQAENELLVAAQDYLDNLGSHLVYSCNTRSIYCEENEIDLEVGQIVTIQSDTMGIVLSRVRGYTKQLFNKYESTYQVGNYSSYSRLGQIEKETSKKADKEEIVEIKDKTGEIKNIIQNLDSKFLSKLTPDTAQGLITFLKGIISSSLEVGGESLFRGLARVLEGIQFGESFAGGLAGFGGKINGAGYGELRGLTVWEFFKATEFIFNKVEINIGDKWNAPGRGKIKSVDTEQRFVELELEDGEIGTIDVDDICMGIFHSVNLEENATSDYDDARGNRAYAGFFTSYFRIIQVMDEQRKSKFRYELRPVSSSYPVQYHPCALMKFTSYGNFTKKERQRSNYETLSYHRYLKDVRDWEFTINNIAAQRGDLSNLNVFGLNMEGYSEYINNVYFTGIIYQLSQQIQDELNKQQIGGKNLLREYDIRFGFKYWGGTGDFPRLIWILCKTNLT